LFACGRLEGLSTNESAQNASQAGEMIPTLGLGIPGSDSMVLVLGALALQGFVPGPQMMRAAPELLYATVAGLLSVRLRAVARVRFAASLRGCDPPSSPVRCGPLRMACQPGSAAACCPSGGVWGNWQPDGFWPR
jgi:hypothetical protein